jgi:hypothetical protein
MCNIAESQIIRHSYKMSKIIQSIFFHQGPLKPAIRRGPLFSFFIVYKSIGEETNFSLSVLL